MQPSQYSISSPSLSGRYLTFGNVRRLRYATYRALVFALLPAKLAERRRPYQGSYVVMQRRVVVDLSIVQRQRNDMQIVLQNAPNQ